MKLLFCPHCQDVLKLKTERRECGCGKSWGLYEDRRQARIGGSAIPLGINNRSLLAALEISPESGSGSAFDAFVIPKDAPSITDDGNGRAMKFRGPLARATELLLLQESFLARAATPPFSHTG